MQGTAQLRESAGGEGCKQRLLEAYAAGGRGQVGGATSEAGDAGSHNGTSGGIEIHHLQKLPACGVTCRGKMCTRAGHHEKYHLRRTEKEKYEEVRR